MLNEPIAQVKSVFIFQIECIMRTEDKVRIQKDIEEQVKTGVVVIDRMIKFIGREILVDGEEVEIIIKQKEQEEQAK